jgi:DNA-binding transcriptional LysR family regulator
MMPMDWDHIRIFLTVARTGQLLAAGKLLHLSHATVARRLDALEARLGARLFERRPTGCIITEAGERLLLKAEIVESDYIDIAESFRDENTQIAGSVRIGAPDGLGNLFLAAELGTLASAHPRLILELVPLPRRFSLSKREADIAIVLDPPVEGRLVVSKLSDYSLSVYASKTYIEKHGRPRDAGDLSSHAVITGVDDLTYSPALDYSMTLEGHAERIFRCASMMGQMEAVRAGSGVGVLHDFAAGHLHKFNTAGATIFSLTLKLPMCVEWH